MIANAVILTSPDPDNEQWTPIHPNEVPSEVKDPDTMGYLLAGDICKVSDLWYMALRHDA